MSSQENHIALPGCISSCFPSSRSHKLEIGLHVLSINIVARTDKMKVLRETAECRRCFLACD